MKYQVTPQQIENELYRIFSEDSRAAMYLTGSHPQYLGVLGWAGPMSPMNRAAFLSAFGAEQVAKAEQAARARVGEYRSAVDRSTYHRNEMAADAFEASGEVPAVGSFVWGRWSCMKGEGGPMGELEDLERMDLEGRENPRRLCEVVAVVDASPAEFMAQDFADGVARQFQDMGGSRYDESDPARLDGVPYSWELVFCVRCADRWYLIDGQGYSYTRYLLFPCDFRAMYREELAGITDAREAQEQAAKEAARMEAERRRAEYLERCAKWAPYMTDATAVQQAYDATPWRDRKAHAAALRKLGSIRRGNISAMIRAAFPALKFSVKKWDGWGGAYEITYIDGPTEAEFTAALDLDLFEAVVDTFDGMTDYAGHEYREFTDFAHRYMGNMSGGVNVSREMSDEARAELVDMLASIAPAARDCKGYDAVTLSVSEMNQYAKMTGADMSAFYHSAHGSHEYRDTPAAFARRAWFERSYMTAAPVPSPTDPTGTDGQGAKGETTEGTPTDGATGAAYGTCEKSQNFINPGEVYKTARANRYIIILSDDGDKIRTTDAVLGRFTGNIDKSDKQTFINCLEAGSIIKSDASQLPPVTDVHTWREGLENGYGDAFQIRTELIYAAADAMTDAEKADIAARMGFSLPLGPLAVMDAAALHRWNASRGKYKNCAAIEWLVTQQDEPTAFQMNAGAYPVIFADYARRI